MTMHKTEDDFDVDQKYFKSRDNASNKNNVTMTTQRTLSRRKSQFWLLSITRWKTSIALRISFENMESAWCEFT